jgi:hypothetical protein
VLDSSCDEDDLTEVRKLVLGHPECKTPDFDKGPWFGAILVTSRHGVRTQWNTASLQKHAFQTGHRVYISQAEDVQVETAEPITNLQKIILLGMTVKQTAKTAERVEIAIGMKVMVIINIATEMDLANGMRGIITDIVRATLRSAQHSAILVREIRS